MTDPIAFDFGADTVAESYDAVLVPRLFEPWAKKLIAEHTDWTGRTVLDLATGTGIVARLLAAAVGPNGRVLAADLNPQMLTKARQRCADVGSVVDFVVTPAHPLDVPDESIDVAVCQQGFQFFPDRTAAAKELLRVLRPGGRLFVSTWCPVTECRFFEWICESLTEIGENELNDLMRLPFDHMSSAHLKSVFEESGFVHITIEKQNAEFLLPGGVPEAITVAYATPIGSRLSALPKERRVKFHDALRRQIERESPDGVTMGQLVAHVLKAAKPSERARVV